MEKLLQHIKICVEFFTRIPVKYDPDSKPDSLAQAAIAFPIIGFLVGALIATVWMIASYFLPSLPAAGLTIAFGIILTGALHEDGLSDCADALGGYVSKERALEIMRDSRIGTYGSAALIMTIGLRWTGLASLDMWDGFVAIIIANMVGRAAIVIPLQYSTYARDKGVASSVSSGIDINTFWMVAIVTALITLMLGNWQGLVALGCAIVTATLTMMWLKKRIGGYTGDGLGAIEQVAEITALLTFLACME